jgi:glyoxylase-like metal-dependent hydrolase (beta-lactamase superfamily II)
MAALSEIPVEASVRKPVNIVLLVAILALPVALAGHGGPAQQQVDWNAVEVTAEKVAGNVWILTGRGGNIGVSVGEDGLLIVDDQFAPLADKIKAKLKDLSSGKLKFVLNTHFHGDHTGGNREFGPEAPIIAHDNVRKRLATPPDDAAARERWAAANPKEAWPVVTFGDRVSIHFNGEEIKAIHFPKGHTDGDSIIFFIGSNVVHMGDDFFAGRFPFVDLRAGGTVQGLTKNIGDVIGKMPADVKIIPGHGPVSTFEDLRTYHKMLLATTGIVLKRKASGMSLDDAKKAGLPEEWKDWGSGFINTERWIETIYNSGQ